MFSIKEERLRDIFSIIEQLIKMVETLFEKNEPVSIQKHLSKLDAMLYMREGMPKELYLEEREKVKRIFEALENDQIKDFMCYPGDIAAAMVSFMGDHLDEEEQKQKELQTLVFNIFQVEAAPVAAKGKVHICLADIAKLPGASGKISWPLDEEQILRIIQVNPRTYLENWLENNQLTALANRYYVYNAFKNADVEISWIQKQGEKLYSPSPYITLLDKLSDVKIQESALHSLDLMTVSGIMPRERQNKEFDFYNEPLLHEFDSKLVYSMCPMRFAYSYVLGDHLSYQNAYQQNRAIIRLIQVLDKLLAGAYTTEQIAEQVFALFPNIRKAEKRQMLDDALKWNLPEENESYTLYQDKNYSDYRLNLLFLDEKVYEYARKNAAMLLSMEGRKGIFHDHGLTAGIRNCEFCPHSGYCTEALFGLDYKGEQE